jgi:hypothetical protein
LRLTEQGRQSERDSEIGNETYCIHAIGAKFLARSFDRSSNNHMTVVLYVCG